MALGGVMAALAVVILSLGGLIPLATYICPMLCILLVKTVLQICGPRIAWAWYGSVSILSMLLGPDKEAAAVFGFLGYYPIVKPKLDTAKFGITNDKVFSRDLLRATNILVVPGSGFDWAEPDHFRLVMLPEAPQLRDAMIRLGNFLDGYHQK